ncbi:hypothetical protein SAMN05428642_104234 [Flaviramulus basaltis]|uniref:Uncharacterized protein n=1 Tax=Flaviramulus basaltis TaxID=369401 RepID=A0A1K2IQD9_9FLAO|nr:alpha/beta hydrolase-fold protein [Flaviramulus basaltis]SFZ94534.1 hypothetical protein SAMN05428642_104234 [Flaviramulus basaltis]
MKYRLKILVILIVTIFINQSIDAQSNGHRFLHNVGVLDSLKSEILNETRTIYVQLPNSYNENENRKYPVAYILDGEIFLPTVSNMLDFYSGGFIPEMVLIGVSNDKNRTRDLTPSHIKTKYGMPFNEENGEAANFIKFIEEQLIPFVEDKYPVTNYRTLIGHSYGGLFTIYSLINHPDLFANYLAIDPSLDWDKQKLLKQAEETFANKNYKGMSLFLSLSGQLHMQNSDITIDNVMQDETDFTIFARSNISFSNLIKKNSQNGLDFSWKFYPKDIHGTIAYPSIMDGLISIFEWFQMENTDKINSFDTSKETLLEIIKYREMKLENHFGYQVSPYPEELLNMSGYMNMDMEQYEKAKMYFELAIEYFPNSANAYDSLSGYYDAKKDYVNALKFAVKAYELSDMDYYKNKVEDLKKKQ